MALNTKNEEVDRLARDVAKLAGETKTEAIRRALLERKMRLRAKAGKRVHKRDLMEYLEKAVWPLIPPEELGRVHTREEQDEILGFGPDGF